MNLIDFSVFLILPLAANANTTTTFYILEPGCLNCVRQGRSWQVGECNPSKECLVQDVGCHETEESCARWEAKQAAVKVCQNAKGCQECVDANSHCGWWVHSQGQDTARCFMKANYWGNPEKVVTKVDEHLCALNLASRCSVVFIMAFIFLLVNVF